MNDDKKVEWRTEKVAFECDCSPKMERLYNDWVDRFNASVEEAMEDAFWGTRAKK